MTRRVKRSEDYEVTLEINSDDFIRPPRDAQRIWVINRALKELTDELEHLNRVAPRFIQGTEGAEIQDRTQAQLDDQQIMEDWQIPIMRQMADTVGSTRGDILEIGFGRGVAAEFVQESEVRSHTIVECNNAVVERFEEWKRHNSGREIELIHGRWQDVTDQFAEYDGILLHTYPLNEEEYFEQVVQSVTFAEHFFPIAAQHLRLGGVFTYLTGEADSLSRAHQRLLFRHFTSFTLSLATELGIPEDSHDATWGDSMAVIHAVK